MKEEEEEEEEEEEPAEEAGEEEEEEEEEEGVSARMAVSASGPETVARRSSRHGAAPSPAPPRHRPNPPLVSLCATRLGTLRGTTLVAPVTCTRTA